MTAFDDELGNRRASEDDELGKRRTSEDAELLAHYIARGREPWNTSLEASWLDYELRAFVIARLPTQRPLLVLNVGIGVGLFDDWLGHVIGGRITSIDRDADICRILELRQRREGHPHPARVICGDVRDGVLDGQSFDVITVVGSTLEESGDRGATTRALQSALTPTGQLLVAEVGQGAAGDRVLTCGDVWLACQTRVPA
ncbi:MAG TPA: class I SAM-dependent methyltransferase [Kofleriaceae bacterium]|nr:class I SAM-dependent methyltransferase [Kofleriaceae bacterium]